MPRYEYEPICADIDTIDEAIRVAEEPIHFSSTLKKWARQTDFITGPSGVGKTTLCSNWFGVLDLDFIGQRHVCLNPKLTARSVKDARWGTVRSEYLQDVSIFPSIQEGMVAGNAANLWRDQLVIETRKDGTDAIKLYPAICRLPWRTFTVLNFHSMRDIKNRLHSPDRINNYGRTDDELEEIKLYSRTIRQALRWEGSQGVPIATSLNYLPVDGLSQRTVRNRIAQAITHRSPPVEFTIGQPLAWSQEYISVVLRNWRSTMEVQ